MSYWRNGVSSLLKSNLHQIRKIEFSKDDFSIIFYDGRVVITPKASYPKLCAASLEQLQNWELCAAGQGIHWPDLDEDLNIEGIILGRK